MAIKHKIKNDKGDLFEVVLSPIKAIRRFCLECMGFQQSEIPKCTAPNCPLFPFRMGKAQKSMSDEQRKQLSESALKRAEIKRGVQNQAQNQEILSQWSNCTDLVK